MKNKYIVKEFHYGSYIECSISPEIEASAVRGEATVTYDPEKKKIQNLNARKLKATRIARANFAEDRSDIILTLTYSPSNAPTLERLHKDLRNYIRKIETERKKELRKVNQKLSTMSHCPSNQTKISHLKMRKEKLESDFKYMYGIEDTIYKYGPYNCLYLLFYSLM